MGIEVDEAVRRRRRLADHGHARRRGDQQGRRVGGDPGATSRTRSSNYPIRTLRQRRQKAKYLPQLTARQGRRVRAVRGRLRLRRVRPGDARRAARRRAWMLNGRKLWITNGAEAGIFVVFANANPEAGYKGITAFIVERGLPRLRRRQEGGQARHPRVEHLRADPRRLRGAGGERARPRRPGLQDRDRDAERRPHRHRRADDRRRAGRARARDRRTSRSASSSASRSPTSRAIQFQLAQAATELEAARLMVYNAARLKDAGQDIAREGAMAKLFSSQVCERVDVAVRRAVRRLRLHQGLPGREVLSRREDRHDLRGHVEHAAADDRQGDPEVPDDGLWPSSGGKGEGEGGSE